MTTAREETSRLADLLRREQHALAGFLIALSAFDAERRWVELGYPSLFAFLTRELRLSAGAAQYRKTAAELIRQFPEIEAALRRGDLCLTSVVEVSKVITTENAAEVLPRFFGKSARDAAFVAASIRPVANPPRREFLVTPVRGAAGAAASAVSTDGAFRAPETESGDAVSPERGATGAPPEAVAGTIGNACGTASAPVAPVAAAAPFPLVVAVTALTSPPSPLLERPRVRPLDAERARVNMTVSRRLLDKLATARDALSHSHPGATEETILELGLDLIIERYRKRRGIGVKRRKKRVAAPKPAAGAQADVSSPPPPSTGPEAPPPPPPISQRNRHVLAAVWRAVWARDGGKCVWPLEGGGVCGSTHRLQLDHVHGFARGADSTAEGCRILCAHHNDLHARELYGDATMNLFTRPKGTTCSEPVGVYGDTRSWNVVRTGRHHTRNVAWSSGASTILRTAPATSRASQNGWARNSSAQTP